MKFKQSLNLGIAIGFAFVIAFIVGCKKKSDATNNSEGNSGVHQIDTSNLQLVTETEKKERGDFQSNVRALALKGDFQNLESQAQDFRSNKSRFKNGNWKLGAFYVAFGDNEKIGNDKAYSDLISQLERWAVEQPDSITPRLALVYAWGGYAFVARGSGWASQVTEQRKRLMEERIEKGFTWLHEAQNLQNKEKDPAFYATGLDICLGANVTREDYEKIFDAGVQNAPDYDVLYEYKAYYLFPRWYGQQGEWETFVRKITQKKDIPGHEEIFARTAIYLQEVGFYWEFSDDDQSWEELKSSFHAMEKSYPDSLEIKSIFCNMCLLVRDYKEARVQMKLLGGKVDMSVWLKKENFINSIQWLNCEDTELEAQRKQVKAHWPPPELQRRSPN
jgi:hypothetical protein